MRTGIISAPTLSNAFLTRPILPTSFANVGFCCLPSSGRRHRHTLERIQQPNRAVEPTDRVANLASNAAVPPLHTPHSITSPGMFSSSMRFAKTYRLWTRSGPTRVSGRIRLADRSFSEMVPASALWHS